MCNIIAIAKLHIKAKENHLHCGNMISELDTEKKYLLRLHNKDVNCRSKNWQQ